MNRDDELRTLLQANRIIHGAEAALMEQIADLDKQRMGRHDTALAERGLQGFANCLSTIGNAES